MSVLAIRRAGFGDFDPVADLVATLDPDEPFDRTAAHHAWGELMTRRDACTWLAWREGRAVGTYALHHFTTMGHAGARVAVVESVAVAPDARGGGVGRAMMDHARQHARELGCYKLMLSSNRTREDAHAFYRRLGFELHGYSFAVELAAAEA